MKCPALCFIANDAIALLNAFFAEFVLPNGLKLMETLCDTLIRRFKSSIFQTPGTIPIQGSQNIYSNHLAQMIIVHIPSTMFLESRVIILTSYSVESPRTFKYFVGWNFILIDFRNLAIDRSRMVQPTQIFSPGDCRLQHRGQVHVGPFGGGSSASSTLHSGEIQSGNNPGFWRVLHIQIWHFLMVRFENELVVFVLLTSWSWKLEDDKSSRASMDLLMLAEWFWVPKTIARLHIIES